MKLVHRLLVIAGKALKLCGMLLLVRCFGIDMAAHLVASASSFRERVLMACRSML